MINDQLFKEREDLYNAMSGLIDEFNKGMADIKSQVLETKRGLQHNGAMAHQFASLKATYIKSKHQLKNSLIDKQIQICKSFGITDCDEALARIAEVEQLRESGRLLSFKNVAAYDPELDLFLTQKVFESWGLSSANIEQLLIEEKQKNSSMSFYDVN